jgi:hypothetical protein
VEVVPELVVVVADVLVVEVCVVLVVVVGVVVLVVALVGVVLLLLVVVVVVGVVLVVVVGVVLVEVVLVAAFWQSCAASWLTVCAPWPKFATSVVLTVEGRFAIALLNERAAPAAVPQSPATTAEESVSSWLLRLLAWSPESRPLLPPHAARNDTAKPSPQARSARDP